MRLDEALTPTVNRSNPHDQAVAQAKANACMIGAIAAAMVEKGVWTLAEAAAAAGQCGIVKVITAEAPTPTPSPAPGMPTEFIPKV